MGKRGHKRFIDVTDRVRLECWLEDLDPQWAVGHMRIEGQQQGGTALKVCKYCGLPEHEHVLRMGLGKGTHTLACPDYALAAMARPERQRRIQEGHDG